MYKQLSARPGDLMNSTHAIACDICANTDWKTHGALLIQCAHCGLIRAKETYAPQELQKLYQHAYYFGAEYSDYLRDRTALEKNFRQRNRFLTRLGCLRGDSAVIEIGCAYGFYLNLLRGKVKSAAGYDVTEEGVAFARQQLGVDASCEDYLQSKNDPADLICMWDVIEHLPNPDRFLQKASQDLAPRGCRVLTTGDIASLMARLQGEHWRLIHPPTHIFYFTPATITKILAKHHLKVISLRYTPVHRNLGSVIQQLSRLKNQGAFRWIQALAHKTGLDEMAFGLNLFDIMEVVAQKEA
jgi:2-polyprenyl-3-methyl-5-hydroxy-6-metoxy-1,4-benzoquinol methylase